MDEDYTKAKEENLKNPKNRFLGLFCHANEVDNSWGCNWSFTTGVVIFSIICGFTALCDVYYIAKDNFFGQASGNTIFKVFFFIKVISDFICLIGIGISCFSINRNNLRYAIIGYYVMVLCLLLHTIYCIYTIIAYLIVIIFQLLNII